MRAVQRFAGLMPVVAFALTTCLLITGCGGGGGNGGGTVTPPVTPPPIDPTPPVDPDPEPPVEPEPEPPVEPPDPQPEPPVEPEPEPPAEPEPPVEPEPEPPVEPEQPPVEPEPEPPRERRGALTVPGIDLIPLDLMKLSNEEMQKRFVVTDLNIEGHAHMVRLVACHSYVTGCPEYIGIDGYGDIADIFSENYPGKMIDKDGTVVVNRAEGTTPFTFLGVDIRHDSPVIWLYDELEKISPSIVTQSLNPAGGLVPKYGTLPYLVVQGAGNDEEDLFGRYVQQQHWDNIHTAIAADTVLYVAGLAPRNDPNHAFYPDTTGLYRRHPESTGCKGAGVDAGCIWAPYYFEDPEGKYVNFGGTSSSAPHVASAIASVLSVFPDTHHTDLARFTKACAKKTGDGIEDLLAQSGGLGVADFTCMGEVVESLTQLPVGGTVHLTIDGSDVTVGGRDLTVNFPVTVAGTVVAGGAYGITPILAGVPHPARQKGLTFSPVITPGGNLTLVGLHRLGPFFAASEVGTRDDFYGYREGHGDVIEAGFSAGHRNAFVRFSEMRSLGGALIDHAEGRSFGATLQKTVYLDATLPLTLAAHTDRFLGGEADFSYGNVRLQKSGWNHRLHVSSALTVNEDAYLTLSAETRLPETGRDRSLLTARFQWRF